MLLKLLILKYNTRTPLAESEKTQQWPLKKLFPVELEIGRDIWFNIWKIQGFLCLIVGIILKIF